MYRLAEHVAKEAGARGIAAFQASSADLLLYDLLTDALSLNLFSYIDISSNQSAER